MLWALSTPPAATSLPSFAEIDVADQIPIAWDGSPLSAGRGVPALGAIRQIIGYFKLVVIAQ
jgi:hypothetical protein